MFKVHLSKKAIQKRLFSGCYRFLPLLRLAHHCRRVANRQMVCVAGAKPGKRVHRGSKELRAGDHELCDRRPLFENELAKASARAKRPLAGNAGVFAQIVSGHRRQRHL